MKNEKVLVVDDDESVLEYLQAALEVSGYMVTTAATATEALGKIRTARTKFPVVLTDIMMPGINGLELLKIIKNGFRFLKVFGMTLIKQLLRNQILIELRLLKKQSMKTVLNAASLCSQD